MFLIILLLLSFIIKLLLLHYITSPIPICYDQQVFNIERVSFN